MQKLYASRITLLTIFSCLAAYSQVIEAPNADVEFIGLRKWSAQNLYDDIVAANPDKPFHACAVYLKDALGFADASVTISISQGRMYILVIVVEPQFASRIHYNTPPKDARPSITRWSNLLELYISHPNEYSLALQLAGYHFGMPDYDISKAGFSFEEETVSIITKIWQSLELLNTPEDEALALETIKNDANYRNRVAALSVLGNFLSHDSAWHAILTSFCDSDARVSSSATAILAGYAQVQKKAVDWSPAVATIRALLDGTNLFAFVPTIKILTATGVSPKLAAPLLKKGGDLLVDFLRAHRQSEKNLAHDLLVQLARRDFGYDSAKWSAWIAALI
jgi:hypothetical protein